MVHYKLTVAIKRREFNKEFTRIEFEMWKQTYPELRYVLKRKLEQFRKLALTYIN
jgi:hypothetical protein